MLPSDAESIVTILVLAAIVLEVIAPPGVLLWLWRGTVSTRLEWVPGVAVVMSTIAVLSLVLPWSAIPWCMRHLYAFAAVGVAAATWRGIPIVRSSLVTTCCSTALAPKCCSPT